jgi:hypothetical protein
MATRRRLKGRKGSRDGFRQAAVIVTVGLTLGASVFAAGDYVVRRQRAPATIKAVVKAEPNGTQAGTPYVGGDEVYTGSILYFPDEGTNCRQLLFDNRSGRFTDNGVVDCQAAEAQSCISSPKLWSAARVRVISDGFRDH